MEGVFLEIPIGECFSLKACISLVTLIFFQFCSGHFCWCKAGLKKEFPAHQMLTQLSCYSCSFTAFFSSAVSGLFLQFHAARKSTLVHLCQFLVSFSYLFLYNTGFIVWLPNDSCLIGIRLFTSFLVFFFCCTPSDLRGGEEFKGVASSWWCSL